MQQLSLFGEKGNDDMTGLVCEVHERLKTHFGNPVRTDGPFDPLSQLIFSLLSQRTRGAEARKAFDCLRKTYPDWYALMLAPTPEIEETIAACNWPEQKAPRLKNILLLINEQCGGLSLDFLERTGTKAAHDWLKDLPGIGPKTGAAVLASSTLNRRILPVDSHHHRIAKRLELIPPKMGVGPAHDVMEDQLPTTWDAEQFNTHVALMKWHGQQTCTHSLPDCPRCVLLDLCPTGQKRVSGDKATA